MQFHPDIEYIIALVAGVLAIAIPRFLRYIVGFFLIAYGILGLLRW